MSWPGFEPTNLRARVQHLIHSATTPTMYLCHDQYMIKCNLHLKMKNDQTHWRLCWVAGELYGDYSGNVFLDWWYVTKCKLKANFMFVLKNKNFLWRELEKYLRHCMASLWKWTRALHGIFKEMNWHQNFIRLIHITKSIAVKHTINQSCNNTLHCFWTRYQMIH